MAVNLSALAGAGWQFFDNTGEPLAGGKLYSYAAGTTTPQTTYTTSVGNVANSNPIVLNAFGRLNNEVWLTTGQAYKFVLEDANSNLIGTYDDISGINDFTNLLAQLANTSNVALGDALIGFRQSTSSGLMTGTIGRTVHQKLQEIVSVRDFNAQGDGTTNDTNAIQAAITAVAAAGGGTVFVPPGNYLIGVVNLASNVSIMGVGEASKFTTSDPTTGAFKGNTVSNIEIAHIFIQGTNIVDPNDPQNGDTGIYLDGCTNVKVHHCHVDGVFAWGLISVDNSDQIDFSNNTITNIGNQSAIGCDNGTTNFIVANNQIKNGKLYGVEVESSNLTNRWGVISGNVVENCVAGISLNFLCEDITIVGNVLRNNNNVNTISSDFGYGVYINGSTGAGTLKPARIIVDSNIIHTHKKYAVLLNGKMNEITVSNNVIVKGGTATQTQNISVVNDPKGFINIINNNIDCSNNSQAIFADQTNRLRVEGNTAQNLFQDLITIGGNVTNAQVQMPYIDSAEASTVSNGANINGDSTNWNYSNEWQEYTVESGSTTYEYLTAKRETRIVGIQWCINPQSVGGGPTDYWTVNIDGSDVNPTLVATVANRDNWSYTPLNVLLSAGGVIRVRILNGAGTLYNHYRYRLIAI